MDEFVKKAFEEAVRDDATIAVKNWENQKFSILAAAFTCIGLKEAESLLDDNRMSGHGQSLLDLCKYCYYAGFKDGGN